VALHLYYVDLAPEVETLLARWRRPFTLFMTLARQNPELTRRVQAVFPGSVIRLVDNRGRDVRPFLLLLEEGDFDLFDLVCKIHGKKSTGGGRFAVVGDLGRRAAFLDLIAIDRPDLSGRSRHWDDRPAALPLGGQQRSGPQAVGRQPSRRRSARRAHGRGDRSAWVRIRV
jgi:lipopolysaccharide biosynthesis protein